MHFGIQLTCTGRHFTKCECVTEDLISMMSDIQDNFVHMKMGERGDVAAGSERRITLRKVVKKSLKKKDKKGGKKKSQPSNKELRRRFEKKQKYDAVYAAK